MLKKFVVLSQINLYAFSYVPPQAISVNNSPQLLLLQHPIIRAFPEAHLMFQIFLYSSIISRFSAF